MPDRAGGHHVPSLPTASFGRRLLCLFYESLLLVAVSFVAALVLLLAAHFAGAQIPRIALQAYLALVACCYFVPQWRTGQTLAMKTWRIRAVEVNGEPLNIRRALMRYILAVVSWLLLGAGYLWALADRDGQFLHDRLAGTRLVALPR